MRYYKNIVNNYIDRVGIGSGGEEITEREYNQILAIIKTKPASTGTTGYRLRTNLTWEEYELEPIEPVEEEATAEEILSILTGESA